jgi:hypothetical protein
MLIVISHFSVRIVHNGDGWKNSKTIELAKLIGDDSTAVKNEDRVILEDILSRAIPKK